MCWRAGGVFWRESPAGVNTPHLLWGKVGLRRRDTGAVRLFETKGNAMTTNGEPVTNAEFRKLIDEQKKAIREIAAERDAVRFENAILEETVSLSDDWIAKLEAQRNAANQVCFLLLAAFVITFFSLLGVLCK